jgi:TonB family protein
MAVAQPSPNVQGLTAQLTDIADRTVHMTGAEGAAIALQQDGNLVTVASCGKSAPDVGVPVRSTSFAGRCFEQGEALVCDDTETDARVDAAGCRVLDIRSMIAVPIRQGKQILGVLAVFANGPSRFGRGEVGLARTLATIAGDLVAPSPQSHPPLGKKAAPKTLPEPSAGPVQPPAEQRKPPHSVQEDKSRTVMHVGADLEPGNDSSLLQRVPSNAPLAKAPPAPTPAPIAAAVPEPKPPKAEPPKPVRAVPASQAKSKRPAEEPAVLSAAEEPRPMAPRPAANNNVQASVLTSYGQPAPRPKPALLFAAGGLALVAAIGAGIWIMHGKSATPDRTVHAASAGTPDRAAVVEKATATSAAPTESVKTLQLAAAKEILAKAGSTSGKPAESAKAAPVERKLDSTASVPASKPVMVVHAAAKAATEEAVAAPSLDLPSSAPLSLGSAKPYVPGAPVSELVPAQIKTRVRPVYPAAALARRAEGKVVLNALVQKDGRVGKVTPISGNVLLRDAAVEAVKRWIYTPASLNGRPTESTVVVEVNFTKQP